MECEVSMENRIEPRAGRTGAAAADPVLAALPTRFAFRTSGSPALSIVLAILGVALIAGGIVVVVTDVWPVMIGAAMLVVGALVGAVPLGKTILPASGKWSERDTAGFKPLTQIRLSTEGGSDRAAELYRIFTTELDVTQWPKLDLQLSLRRGISVTVYRRADGSAVMTIVIEGADDAHAWPLIEPTADVTAWLRRIVPKPNSSGDQSANMPYLYD